MFIPYLKLTKFRWLKLLDTDSIELNFTSKIQVFVGSNGSGKSSVVRECTPWLPDPNSFEKGGSKVITILHHGSTYTLTSVLENSWKHSFIKDRIEYNQGGTGVVQKELIKQEFGITAEINNLMLGLEQFPTMGPTTRRDWLTRLSVVSFDYAIKMFKTFKEHNRDLNGALTEAKKRLVAETAKMMSQAELDALENELVDLEVDLSSLQALRSPVTTSVAELNKAYNRLLETINTTTGWLIDHRNDLEPSREYASAAEQEAAIKQAEQEHAVAVSRYEASLAEHNKIKETHDLLVQTGNQGEAELLAKQQLLRQEQEEYCSGRQLGLMTPEPILAHRVLDDRYMEIVDLISSLPSNRDGKYSKEKLEGAEKQLATDTQTLHELERKLLQLQTNIEQHEKHRKNPAIVCPSCQFTWIHGFDVRTYEEVLALERTVQAQIHELQASTAKLSALVEDYEQYKLHYRNYVQLTKQTPVLEALWSLLNTDKLVLTEPREAALKVITYRQDLELERNAALLEPEIKELETLRIQASKIGTATLEEIKAKLEASEAEVGRSVRLVTDGRALIQRLQAQHRAVKEYLEVAQAQSGRMQGISSLVTEMIETKWKEAVIAAIQSLQTAMAIKAEALAGARVKKAVIADIERNIEDLKLRAEASRLLVQEISPKNGLIADGLMGFIKDFVKSLNKVIREVWTYPYEILPCGFTSGETTELDYKFRVRIGTDVEPAGDIAQASDGQKEIISRAFQRVAMKCLNLHNMPIYLDEFGRAFDDAHQIAATVMVKNIVDRDEVSQVFLISHYMNNYGALGHAEICVLCPDNIQIPGPDYNKHVRFF